MDKKYEILMDTEKVVDGHVLHRIGALRDFGLVRKGDIGGWIQSEDNLSHAGDCFIFDEACVYEAAMIYDDALVSGQAQIFNNANVCENSRVCDIAHIFGSAYIAGFAIIEEDSRIYDTACVYGYARIKGHGIVAENMAISDGCVTQDLSHDLKESIRCQTGLGVFNNKIIAYKQVWKDLTSIYDPFFKYKVGETIEAAIKEEDLDKEKSCGSGLHFSNMNYWTKPADPRDTAFLMAEIDLDDVIAVQEGKIRCKKAKILGVYEI